MNRVLLGLAPLQENEIYYIKENVEEVIVFVDGSGFQEVWGDNAHSDVWMNTLLWVGNLSCQKKLYLRTNRQKPEPKLVETVESMGYDTIQLNEKGKPDHLAKCVLADLLRMVCRNDPGSWKHTLFVFLVSDKPYWIDILHWLRVVFNTICTIPTHENEKWTLHCPPICHRSTLECTPLVLWDLDNMGVGSRVAKFAQDIVQEYGERQWIAMCRPDSSNSSETRNALQAVGVQIWHTSDTPEAADRAILCFLIAWMATRDPKSISIISNDRDFDPALKILKEHGIVVDDLSKKAEAKIKSPKPKTPKRKRNQTDLEEELQITKKQKTCVAS